MTTTGLAVSKDFLAKQPQLVSTMIAIYSDSLALFHSDDEILKKVLVDDFSFNEDNLAQVMAIVRACYRQDGLCPAPVGDKSIKDLSKQLAFDGRKNLSGKETSLYVNV